ncbi:MAG TPA: MFS transporter [Dehalococcoidia bacterium]|nr:MFS transporter [Dehalococcoidia bacterium]
MASAASTVSQAPAQAISAGSRQRAVLTTAVVGNFVLMMAISPVSAILPTIAADLRADVTLVGWIMTLFFLALTSSVLIVGRFGDIYGHAKVFTVGTLCFTVSSILAGLSQNIFHLIAARAFQGVAAAMIMACGFALIGNNFPPNQRGRAVGLITTATGASTLFGTFLSTTLVGNNLSWRWMFFAMVPLGLLGLFVANKLRGVITERYPSRIDIAGAIFIFLTLATLSLSFNHLHEGGESFQEGWYYHLPMHALTLLFLGALIFVELRSPAPLIDFRIFKNGTFSSALVANGICHSTMMGTSFLFPFLIERGLQLGTRDTMFMLSGMSLMLTVCGLLGGWLYDRFRSPFLAPAGISVVAIGLIAMGLLATTLSYVQFVAIGIVLGVAMGIFFTVNNVMIISSLPNSLRGLASGMEQSSRQLGHTLGITATSAAMAISVPREMMLNAPAEAWVEGFQRAVITVGIIAAVGAVIALVKRGPAKIGAAAPQPVPARPQTVTSTATEYPVRVGAETWTFVVGGSTAAPARRAASPAGAD